MKIYNQPVTLTKMKQKPIENFIELSLFLLGAVLGLMVLLVHFWPQGMREF